MAVPTLTYEQRLQEAYRRGQQAYLQQQQASRFPQLNPIQMGQLSQMFPTSQAPAHAPAPQPTMTPEQQWAEYERTKITPEQEAEAARSLGYEPGAGAGLGIVSGPGGEYGLPQAVRWLTENMYKTMGIELPPGAPREKWWEEIPKRPVEGITETGKRLIAEIPAFIPGMLSGLFQAIGDRFPSLEMPAYKIEKEAARLAGQPVPKMGKHEATRELLWWGALGLGSLLTGGAFPAAVRVGGLLMREGALYSMLFGMGKEMWSTKGQAVYEHPVQGVVAGFIARGRYKEFKLSPQFKKAIPEYEKKVTEYRAKLGTQGKTPEEIIVDMAKFEAETSMGMPVRTLADWWEKGSTQKALKTTFDEVKKAQDEAMKIALEKGATEEFGPIVSKPSVIGEYIYKNKIAQWVAEGKIDEKQAHIGQNLLADMVITVAKSKEEGINKWRKGWVGETEGLREKTILDVMDELGDEETMLNIIRGGKRGLTGKERKRAVKIRDLMSEFERDVKDKKFTDVAKAEEKFAKLTQIHEKAKERFGGDYLRLTADKYEDASRAIKDLRLRPVEPKVPPAEVVKEVPKKPAGEKGSLNVWLDVASKWSTKGLAVDFFTKQIEGLSEKKRTAFTKEMQTRFGKDLTGENIWEIAHQGEEILVPRTEAAPASTEAKAEPKVSKKEGWEKDVSTAAELDLDVYRETPTKELQRYFKEWEESKKGREDEAARLEAEEQMALIKQVLKERGAKEPPEAKLEPPPPPPEPPVEVVAPEGGISQATIAAAVEKSAVEKAEAVKQAEATKRKLLGEEPAPPETKTEPTEFKPAEIDWERPYRTLSDEELTRKRQQVQSNLVMIRDAIEGVKGKEKREFKTRLGIEETERNLLEKEYEIRSKPIPETKTEMSPPISGASMARETLAPQGKANKLLSEAIQYVSDKFWGRDKPLSEMPWTVAFAKRIGELAGVTPPELREFMQDFMGEFAVINLKLEKLPKYLPPDVAKEYMVEAGKLLNIRQDVLERTIMQEGAPIILPALEWTRRMKELNARFVREGKITPRQGERALEYLTDMARYERETRATRSPKFDAMMEKWEARLKGMGMSDKEVKASMAELRYATRTIEFVDHTYRTMLTPEQLVEQRQIIDTARAKIKELSTRPMTKANQDRLNTELARALSARSKINDHNSTGNLDHVPLLLESGARAAEAHRYLGGKQAIEGYSLFERHRDLPQYLQDQYRIYDVDILARHIYERTTTDEFRSLFYLMAKVELEAVTKEGKVVRGYVLSPEAIKAGIEPPKGWKKVASEARGKSYGALTDHYVHPALMREVNFLWMFSDSMKMALKLWNTGLHNWRFMKAVLNIPNFIRNPLTNYLFFMPMQGMYWRDQVKYHVMATKLLEGPEGLKWMEHFTRRGLIGTGGTAFIQEGKRTGNVSWPLVWKDAERFLQGDRAALGEFWRNFKATVTQSKYGYGWWDDMAKISMYLWQKDRGLSSEAAGKFVRERMPDYSLWNKPQSVRIIRNSISPFFLFTYESTRVFLNTLKDRPLAVMTVAMLPFLAQKIMNEITGLTTEQTDALREQRRLRTGRTDAEIITGYDKATKNASYMPWNYFSPLILSVPPSGKMRDLLTDVGGGITGTERKFLISNPLLDLVIAYKTGNNQFGFPVLQPQHTGMLSKGGDIASWIMHVAGPAVYYDALMAKAALWGDDWFMGQPLEAQRAYTRLMGIPTYIEHVPTSRKSVLNAYNRDERILKAGARRAIQQKNPEKAKDYLVAIKELAKEKTKSLKKIQPVPR